MTVDIHGNLWATGPGGVNIFSPQGEFLGRISPGVATANCCFGGQMARHYLSRPTCSYVG